MKKKILAVALCAAMIIGAVAVSASAWGFSFSLPIFAQKQAPTPKVEYYPLYVNGIQVTSENAKDIPFNERSDERRMILTAGATVGAGMDDPRFAPKQGKASYDAKTNTLTLDGVSIQNTNYADCIWYEDDTPEEDTFTIRVLHNSTLEMINYPSAEGGEAGAIYSDADHTVIEIAPGQSLMTRGWTTFNDLTVKGGTWYAYNPCEFVNYDLTPAAIDVWGTFTVKDAVVYGYSQNGDLWDSYYYDTYNNYAAIDVDELVVNNSLVYGVIEKPVGYYEDEDDWRYAHTNDSEAWYWDGNGKHEDPEDDPYEYDWVTGINAYTSISGDNVIIKGSPLYTSYFDAVVGDKPINWGNLWYAPDGATSEYTGGYEPDGSFWIDLDPDGDDDFDYAPASTVCIMSEDFCGRYQALDAPENYAILDMVIRPKMLTASDNKKNFDAGTFEFIQAEDGWIIKAILDPADLYEWDGGYRPLFEAYLAADFEEGGAYIYYSDIPYVWSYNNVVKGFYATHYKMELHPEYLFVTTSHKIANGINNVINAINKFAGTTVPGLINKYLIKTLNELLKSLGIVIKEIPTDGNLLRTLEFYTEGGVQKWGFKIGDFMENVGTDYYISEFPKNEYPEPGEKFLTLYGELSVKPTTVRLGKLVQMPKHDFECTDSSFYQGENFFITGNMGTYHELTCKYCGTVTYEECKYNRLTHKCDVCGAMDPAYTKVNGVTVNLENAGFTNTKVTVHVDSTAPVTQVRYCEFDPHFMLTDSASANDLIEYITVDPKDIRNNTFSYITSSAPQGLSVEVKDANGRIWSYEWVFGEGQEATLMYVSFGGIPPHPPID